MKILIEMAIQQVETQHGRELCEIDNAGERVLAQVKKSIQYMTRAQLEYRYPEYNEEKIIAYIESII